MTNPTTTPVSETKLPPAFAVDHSADTQLRLTGADRVKFLQGFCTNDVKLLAVGQGCEAFITNHQGKTIGHVVVSCEADALVMNTVPGQAEKLIQHFDRFIITEDVALQDETNDRVKWMLAGEQVEQRLQDAGLELPAKTWEFLATTVDEMPLQVRRVPCLGTSFFVSTLRKNAEQLATLLLTWNLPVCENRELLAGARIDANWPVFGQDIHDDNLPQEIGRNQQAISFKKGCYLGQETVARLDALGHVNRILTRVKVTPAVEGVLPIVGTELQHEGKTVGKITSVGWSPELNAPIAFALIRVAHVKQGTRLESSSGEAEVV